ncbi:MAG: hypothetical protein M3388_05650 [Acidobacteriota bacterium]|nr:hypothetical protein [Acidobacteriota bacterium]
MNIEGIWSVRYSAKQQEPFSNEEGDAEEIGEITLKEGKVTGNNPFGGQYEGEYQINDENIKAKVKVASYEDDGETIFDNVDYPFYIELEGKYLSPDFFSMLGVVAGNSLQSIVLNCKRISD